MAKEDINFTPICKIHTYSPFVNMTEKYECEKPHKMKYVMQKNRFEGERE